GRRIMRKLVALLVLFVLSAPALPRELDDVRQLVDRAAILEVMQKYVWSVDALDADGYVSVFTEDAVVESQGIVHKGHAEIRKVVTDLLARQATNRAEGKP